MLANSKRKEGITNCDENFQEDDNDGFEDDSFGISNTDDDFFNCHNNDSNIESDDESQEGQSFVSKENNRMSHSTDNWKSPFATKKYWNYKAILNDGAHPRIKISAKNKVKKSKSSRSRNDSPRYRNVISSLHDSNSLKTRLKFSSSDKLSKKKSKQRKKLAVTLIDNIYNGVDSADPIVDESYENDLVPNQPNINIEQRNDLLRKNHYGEGREEAEYAQYLELKPSVKFKCCRCGTNDFTSMALLQEHMACCNGKPSSSVTSNPSLDLSTSLNESRHPSVARNLKIKRKVLLCSSCGTYYQHYNLYVHMRDKHNKEICLFCRNTFSKPQHLWDHLVSIHNMNSVVYSNAAQVRDAFKSFFITCCTCNVVFSDQDKFSEHVCNSHETEKKEESLYTGDQLVYQEKLQNNIEVGEVSKRENGYMHVESTNNVEPGNTTADASDESILDDITMNVLGIPEKPVINSLNLNSEVAADSDTQVADDTHFNSTENDDKDPDEAVPSVETNESSTLETQTAFEMGSPVVHDPEETLRDDMSSSVEPAEETNVDDTPEEQSIVKSSVHVSNNDEFSIKQSTIEQTNSEDTASLKKEEKSFNWLESDDETENSALVLPQNEIQPLNSEPASQPVAMALMLDEAVSSLSIRTIINECVRTSCSTCLYCNNATLITVNGGQLAAHLRSEHRYMPTKLEDSPEQVIQKIEQAMTDLKDVFMNSSSSTETTEFNGTFSCQQCPFTTSLFKELCHHKRKMHHKVIFLCIMCKCSFLYYSQLLCHLCPGFYSPETQNALNYHCCFCKQEGIPSAFRLMVHLRKIHQACDICLTRHNDQSELFSHMIKQHKMNHLCYKCNLAYRSRDGINEHLFWKHGTESVLCKRCLQKKWPHAYHFCIPASTYTCEECSRIFTKAVALTVHRRAHIGNFPFGCSDCEQRFISKKLLSGHQRDLHGIKSESNEVDAKTEQTNGENGDEKKESAENEEDKKRRKKKRKKEKTDIEKPILDELPPLNLSSESEEDSAEDEVTKPTATEAESALQENLSTSTLDETEPAENGEPSSSKVSAVNSLPVESPAHHNEEKTPTDENETSVQINNDDNESRDAEGEAPTEEDSETLAVKDGVEASVEEGNIETPIEKDDIKIPAEEENVEASAEKENVETETATEIDSTEKNDAESLVDENQVETKATSNDPEEIEEPKVSTKVALETKTEENIENAPIFPVIPGEEKTSTEVTKEEVVKCLSPEKQAEISIERIRNCLIIEHSYCIPDSIFHSEGPDAETSLEAIAQKLSPKSLSRSRDKSCSKSITPRKRKRPLRRDSSSSDSSSDSDSSSSSCGSNCSCAQKSNSNCSSSSSGSEYSTTPDKKHSKSDTRMDTTVTNDEEEESKKEELLLLNARESDLDTDIETSDEDFYDQHPSSTIRVEEKPPDLPTPEAPTVETAEPLAVKTSRKKEGSSRKNRKRRKTPKITINIGSPQKEASMNAHIAVNLHRIDDPSQKESVPIYKHSAMNDGRLGIHLCKTTSSTYTSIPNNFANDTSMCLSRGNMKAAGDASGRRSKRERVKNKFYGYSSSDEGSDNESVRPAPNKKRLVPKQPKVAVPLKQPFIGIRAKKSLIMPQKRSPSVTTATTKARSSLPAHLFRMPNYIKQQQQEQQRLMERQQQLQHQEYRQNQAAVTSSSSDDSDSDNLVINEPSLNERNVNNHPMYRLATHSTVEATAWQRNNVPPHGVLSGYTGPPRNDERLYCYCRCPYDEVSEMIGCDGENCPIEWFHFECVGIMVPPKGKWYCPNCKNREAVSQFV